MNLKFIYLLRALTPYLTRKFVFVFENLIMRSLGQLFDFEPQIQTICQIFQTQEEASDWNKELTTDMRTLLDQYLIRQPEACGGLGILPMTQMVESAFYAATVRILCFRHQQKLPSCLPPSDSPPTLEICLSQWFYDTAITLTALGAKLVLSDSDVPPHGQGFFLRDTQKLPSGSELENLEATLATSARQHKLTEWFRQQAQDHGIFRELLDASPADKIF